MSITPGQIYIMDMLAGGGFTPARISGLQLWLDANNTLYQDAAKTIPAGDGDVVGAWPDLSGGNDATQSTTAKKPLLDLDVLGSGYPGVLFDNADDFLTWSDFGLNAMTIYFVTTGVDNGSADNTLFDLQNDGANPYRVLLRLDHVQNRNDLFMPIIGNFNGVSDPAGKHLHIFQAIEGGAFTWYYDSSTIPDRGPTIKAGNWINNTITDSRIGLTVSDDKPFNGYCHSLLIYSTSHTSAEREPIAAYLADRYGVVLS